MSQSFETDVSADFPFELQRVEVLDSYMTYIDTGSPNSVLTKTLVGLI
jgi:haloalkane dehalogenase